MATIKELLSAMIDKINGNEDKIDNIKGVPEAFDSITMTNGTDTAKLTMNAEKELLFDGEPVGGGVTSWNDLQGKPFGETISEQELIFDASVNTEAYSFLRKVSDTPMTKEEIIGAIVVIATNGTKTTTEVTDAMVTDGEGYFTAMVTDANNSVAHFISIYEEQTEEGFGMAVPVGVYVAYSNESKPYVKRISFSKETVHTIDPKYLPDWLLALKPTV